MYTVNGMSDEVVVVTGATGGIGRAICARLARDGGRTVIAADLAGTRTDSVSDPRFFVECDVTSTASVNSAFEKASEFGRVSSVVLAAGVVGEVQLHEMSDDQWQQVREVSLDGAFRTIRAALPSLRNGGGSIVALSSGWASQGYPAGAHYAAAKAGLEGLIRSVARGYASDGVRANALAPGPIDTPMLRNLPGFEERLSDRAARIPLGRIGTAEEIADAVAWLASDQSSYITGQVIQVSGGLVV